MPLAPLKDRKQLMAACLERDIAIEGWNYCATLDPDGATLLLGRNSGILVIDLVSGGSREVEVPAAVYDAVSCLEFTADRTRVIATLWVGSVAVLTWPELRCVAVHRVCDTRLHGLAVLQDGRSAWLGGHDGRRTRIDLDDGTVLAACADEQMWMADAALSPDGELLVTADAAGNVRLCDPQSGAERRLLRISGSAQNMSFHGEELLVPSLTTAIVDVASGETRAGFTGEHKLGAQTATFVTDELVATGGAHDPLLVLWDRTDGSSALTLKPYNKGAIERVLLTPDREHLVVVPRCDQAVQIWRATGLVEAARRSR
ncbi:WD40 repeat domain-containing protein [Nannocystis bainbridge]|uniref:WD40 repeat domain-containing protein n=1 Tax=Nannocystis bainbridge TaxID=2995303 RepID=A0ABT5DU74_9BACT|nr:WD40 repeat domain-containing protein [Nannocystis bainbridge]MDC0716668.1 WD40 repeat domain-containing protein [Nannocystis bainbridge]